ncbi:MAG: PPC domain-containing protein [Phototrophicales bacterium]|nr:PPC domain-containing protein [Phototrophicales bacterium]
MKMLTFTFRTLAIALVLVGLVLTVNATSAQQTPEFTPPMLTRGEIVTGTFEPEVNAHIYAFNGRANDFVTISMIQPSDSQLDPYLILLSGDGAVIMADDDSGPRLFSALIENVQLPTDGTYFVVATTKSGERFDFEGIYGSAGAIPRDLRYEISLAGTWVESEELDYTASSLSNSAPVVATVTKDVPVVYATLTGRSGDVVTITTANNGAEMDTILYLFDADGNRVAVNDDGDNMNYFSQINRFTLPENGFYFVIATSYGFNTIYEARGDWDGAGSFNLTIN